MTNSIKTTGILSKEELMKAPGMPSKERLKKGRVAIIECIQRIPCDPCVAGCPENAIEIGTDITNLPRLNEDKCIGCGKCISLCPGLAIFVLDLNYSSEEALLLIPYESLPIPKSGSVVMALNREGKEIEEVKVQKINNSKKNDRTAVISLLVPKDLSMDIRYIRV